MDVPELEPVLDLVAARDWPSVATATADWPLADIADLVDRMPASDAAVLLRSMSRHHGAEVFAHLEPDHQEDVLEVLTDQEIKDILLELEPDDRTALLEDLPEGLTRRLFLMLPHAEVVEAQGLLGYPEESVGRLMTPDFLTLRGSMTVDEALAHVRSHGRDSETLNRIFVADRTGRLLGDLRLRQIVLGRPDQTVREIMHADCARLVADEDREEAVRLMGRADATVLPVVDKEGMLVGIVTADDVFDVAEEEVTEDIHNIAAVSPLDRSYRRSDVGHLYKRRIVWLGGLIFVSLASSFVIAGFEDTLAASIGLAFFIPILMATGGNTGSQSSMLMVRALATEEVSMEEWARSFGKELLVGLALGATLGIMAAAVGIFRSGTEIALIVGGTMMALVIVANLLGMSLPFFLERIGVDPAVASAPLITVIIDAIGLLIFFTTASIVL